VGADRTSNTTRDQDGLTMSPKEQKPNALPPRWPDKLVQLFCAPHLLEEVMGDLHERYYLRVQKEGEAKAKRRYCGEVLAYVRPSVFKRKTNTYNTILLIDMLQHYIITTFRRFRRQIGISLSYLTGLTLGIASSLLIFLIVMQEYSFDQYHTNADRIYRMETTKVEQSKTYSGTPTGVPAALRSDFQAIEKVGVILHSWKKLVTVERGKALDKYKEPVAFVENDVFQMLDFQWLNGSAVTALNVPNTVVLSASYAQKYFGSSAQAKVLGKTIQIDDQDWMVTGIVADPPVNTNFPFHIMASYANIKNADAEHDQHHGGWSDSHQTYVLLKDGALPQEIEEQFPQMIEKYMGEEALQKRAYALLPLDQIHFEHNFGGRSANPELLKTLMVVGLFLLLIACANFINLATAQGIKRAREVGVRKVLGSNRLQLIHQFLSEAGFITFLALLLSLSVAYLSLPYVSQLMGITIAPHLIWRVPSIVFLLSIFLFTSLLAGFYPALVLSSLNPVSAIKKRLKGRLTRGLSLRNGLVIFQFGISLVLILGTLVIGQQLQLFKNANLGFDHEAIITVDIPDRALSKLEAMRQELLDFPSIQNVSFSNNSPSSQTNSMATAAYNPDGEVEEIYVQTKMVDSYFLDTYDIPLIAGQQFREGDTLPKAIINEVMIGRMSLSNPQDAIGQTLHLGQKSLPVIGVVKDFHVNSLHQKIDPTILFVDPQAYYQGNIKLHQANLTAEDIEKTIAHLQQVWTSTFPEHIFAYQFLDQTLEEAYWKEIRTAQLVNTATGMAIFISCLGLLGLIVFTAEQRMKEIGVRKVLGASTGSIFGLFTKDYLKLILIANAFAWPIAWWGMRKWLENFEYSIEISWWMFAIAALAGIAIAGLTISFQAIKAAVANPVDSLRNE
jgi:putative ABC transport system permease protein